MRRSPLLRPVTAVLAAALTAGVLAGCSGVASAAGCDLAPGDASTTISATGEIGSTPDTDFPTPLIADEVERSVLTAGDGDEVAPGATVQVSFVYYVGATGEVLGEQSTLLSASEGKRALGEAMACATVGSRIAVVGPATEIDAAYEGITETLVAVVDIEQVFLGKANGVNQLPLDGMPTVVTAVDGTPGIALAYTEEPDESRVATIKAGSGAVVRDGDALIYHLRAWNWPAMEGDKPTINTDLDTWAAFTPGQVDLDASAGRDFDEAVVGSKVGSQVLLVIPAPEGGQAAIAVIDILGILEQ